MSGGRASTPGSGAARVARENQLREAGEAAGVHGKSIALCSSSRDKRNDFSDFLLRSKTRPQKGPLVPYKLNRENPASPQQLIHHWPGRLTDLSLLSSFMLSTMGHGTEVRCDLSCLRTQRGRVPCVCGGQEGHPLLLGPELGGPH